jgi:hypothetical protein
VTTHAIYRSAERYDPREGFWVRLPSMTTRRGCQALTVLGDALSVNLYFRSLPEQITKSIMFLNLDKKLSCNAD